MKISNVQDSQIQQNHNQEIQILTSRLKSQDIKIIQDSLKQLIEMKNVDENQDEILNQTILCCQNYKFSEIGQLSLQLIINLNNENKITQKLINNQEFIQIIIDQLVNSTQKQENYISNTIKLINQLIKFDDKFIEKSVKNSQNFNLETCKSIIQALIQSNEPEKFEILNKISEIIKQKISTENQEKNKIFEFLKNFEILNQIFIEIQKFGVENQNSLRFCELIQQIFEIQLEFYTQTQNQEVKNQIVLNLKLFNDLYNILVYFYIKNTQNQIIQQNLKIITKILIKLIQTFKFDNQISDYVINSKIFDFSLVLITQFQEQKEQNEILNQTLFLINQIVQLNDKAQIKFAISVTSDSQQRQTEVLMKIAHFMIKSEDQEVRDASYNILTNVLTHNQAIQLSACASLSKVLRQSRKGSWQDGFKIIAKVFAIKQENKFHQMIIDDENIKQFVQNAQKQMRQIDMKLEKPQYEISQQAMYLIYENLISGNKEIVESGTLLKNILVGKNNCYHFAVSCMNIQQLQQLGSNQYLITDNINNQMILKLIQSTQTEINEIELIRQNQIINICLQLILYLQQESIEIMFLPATHNKEQMKIMLDFIQTEQKDQRLKVLCNLIMIYLPKQLYKYAVIKQDVVENKLLELQQIDIQFDEQIKQYIQNNSEKMKQEIQNKFQIQQSPLQSSQISKDKYVSLEEYNRLKVIIEEQKVKIQKLEQQIQYYQEQQKSVKQQTQITQQQDIQKQEEIQLPPKLTPEQIEQYQNQMNQKTEKQVENKQVKQEVENLYIPGQQN